MSAGLIGFLVILGLIVAAVLLFRSMSAQMRKVPERFDEPTADEPTADEPTADDAAGQSSGPG